MTTDTEIKLSDSTVYTCCGGASGNCGVAHRTREAARRCIARHDPSGVGDRYIDVLSGPVVVIETANVGCHFGTVGVIKSRNGRTVWTSEPVGYGCTTAAMALARNEARARCWTAFN
jgi:hypothetical protein